jgi:hypothetical protein
MKRNCKTSIKEPVIRFVAGFVGSTIRRGFLQLKIIKFQIVRFNIGSMQNYAEPHNNSAVLHSGQVCPCLQPDLIWARLGTATLQWRGIRSMR